MMKAAEDLPFTVLNNMADASWSVLFTNRKPLRGAVSSFSVRPSQLEDSVYFWPGPIDVVLVLAITMTKFESVGRRSNHSTS